LAADLDTFGEVGTRGLLPTEEREFERDRRITTARLRQEVTERGSRRRTALIPGLTWTRSLGLAAAAMLVGLILWPQLGRDAASGGVTLPDGSNWSAAPPPFSAPPATRDAGNAEELWTGVGAAWAASDWSRAGQILAEILARQPDSHDAALYAGAALVMQARYDEAAERLQLALRLSEEQLGGPGAQVSYYLGLAELGRGRPEAARQALTTAGRLGGPDGERATELLGRLSD
jgi:tetratricopeptide (TPR) repeat protein